VDGKLRQASPKADNTILLSVTIAPCRRSALAITNRSYFSLAMAFNHASNVDAHGSNFANFSGHQINANIGQIIHAQSAGAKEGHSCQLKLNSDMPLL
jgi:hypothetical protein